MTFATCHRKARKRAGLTQEREAELLGVSRTTVTQWEKGVSRPRCGHLASVADVLDCTVSELLGEAEMTERKGPMSAKNIRDVYPQTMADLESLHLSVTNAMCKSKPGTWERRYFLGLMRAIDELLCAEPVEDGTWEWLQTELEDEAQ